jgi:polyisoprenoid-binding protein YceI
MKRSALAFISLSAAFSLAPLTSRAEVVHFGFNPAAMNMVKIEIPAPLETTRAQLSGVRGMLDIDLADPMKTAGSIEADLSGIKSHSFTDQDKNDTQTEHMHNWFEIGGDVPAAQREKNQWARFTITKIEKVDPPAVDKAATFTDDIGTGRRFKITAGGDFTVHGVTKPKVVELDATLYDVKAGSPQFKDAQRVLILHTEKPFVVSLKEHDVKPRDTTGKFLAGALQVVGLKLSDEAQVSLDLRAVQAKSK